jgi:hypothetical protein
MGGRRLSKTGTQTFMMYNEVNLSIRWTKIVGLGKKKDGRITCTLRKDVVEGKYLK